MLDFLKDFEKDVAKIDGVGGSSKPPRHWYSIGNYVANRIISGSFYRGIPQGRITGLVGPSGAGKSFLLANLICSAQMQGAHIFALDSENALDDDYMTAVGVDVLNGYTYKSVTTIPHVIKLVSGFVKMYEATYGTMEDNPDQPPVLIALDSLDMLATDTELEHFGKGNQTGDQGQRAKQLKAMLRQFVQAIKDLNIAIVVTGQVYAASQEQKLAGEGVWVVNQAIRYALSQIILVTKLKLKTGEGGSINGVRMKVEGFKTRFTQPFQTVTIEVPYTTGMEPTSGLIESLEGMGVLKRGGSWYSTVDGAIKFQSKDLALYVDQLLEIAEAKADVFLKVVDEEEDEKQGASKKETSAKRKLAAAGATNDDAGDE